MSTGRGIAYLIIVLIEGFGPAGPISVVMLSTAILDPTGKRFLKSNVQVAFLTGRIPTDCKFLNPRTRISKDIIFIFINF